MRWSKKASITRNPENQLSGVEFRDQLQRTEEEQMRLMYSSNRNTLVSGQFRD